MLPRKSALPLPVPSVSSVCRPRIRSRRPRCKWTTLHELTTNAAKHGALSVPEGRIAIRWDIEQTPAARMLHLDWTERGGPATAAPTRKGFGSTLLQRVLKVQCQAEIAFDFQPAGLHFTMRAPLPETRVVPAY